MKNLYPYQLTITVGDRDSSGSEFGTVKKKSVKHSEGEIMVKSKLTAVKIKAVCYCPCVSTFMSKFCWTDRVQIFDSVKGIECIF